MSNFRREAVSPVIPGEQDLIRRISNGDRAALAELYDIHAPGLLALAMRILGNRGAAEDLLHDLFLEVWNSASDYKSERGTVKTWLFVRLRSRAIDRLRSAKRQQPVSESWKECLEIASPNPATLLDRLQVCQVLATLPKEQCVILELGYFKGLTCSEIAARLEIPVGTVKSRTAAAMEKLRAALRLGEVDG